MDIIEIEHLKKYYKDVKAVDDISFSVREGEFFSFLGVNGAGKSTTISILAGLLPRDEGKVFIGGREPDMRTKCDMGVVFQDSVLDKAFSVRENLKLRAALYGYRGKEALRRVEEMAELFSLKEFWNRPVGLLSGGQRRRADIARALLHGPRILILDEPTTGLDPQTRKYLWETIGNLRKERGITVFLTTHYMEEAAESDRVVIIDGGKILADDTPLCLKEKYTEDSVTLYHVCEEDVRKLGFPYEKVADGYRLKVSLSRAASLIAENRALFSDFEVTKGKMDDVFLVVTGKRLQGGQ